MNKILKKLKDDPEKILYWLQKRNLLSFLSDETYIKIAYRMSFGRSIDLKNPKAFTEKLNWYKLYYHNELMKRCADKYDVRDYVIKKVGRKYLNDCFGVWNNIDSINFDCLPNQFVLKPTNGSGDVFICKNKRNLNINNLKKVLYKNKNIHFSRVTKEWAYYDLPFRIIAERYIESSDNNQIKDYKFFCFDGEPKFLFVGSERGTDHLKFDFYDMDWNWLPVANVHEQSKNIKRPKHFAEMVEICRKLSNDFPHVRIDLYEEEGKVFFGEMTFYHFGGFAKFTPDEWDYKFGEFFNIDKIKK